MADSCGADSFQRTVSLGRGSVGLQGKVLSVRSLAPGLEQTLLEIGFVEGARVEILHQGPFGRDPIAVRIDGMRVALRRTEAESVLIMPLASPAFAEAGYECD